MNKIFSSKALVLTAWLIVMSQGYRNALFEIFPPESKIINLIENLWIFTNYADFCFMPKPSTFTLPFLYSFYRQYNIDIPEIEAKLDNKDYFAVEGYHQQETPKIPLKTHRVWITDPTKGTEFIDAIGNNQTFLDEIVKSNKALDDNKHHWSHYFWTNDAKAIPRSVEWFKANGFVVRELRELSEKAYDKVTQQIIEEY